MDESGASGVSRVYGAAPGFNMVLCDAADSITKGL
jgi:hypothetical protein